MWARLAKRLLPRKGKRSFTTKTLAGRKTFSKGENSFLETMIEARRRMGEELIKAAFRGDVETVVDLLNAGADPNFRDEYKRTPLGEAIHALRPGVVKILLEYGADPDLSDWSGFSPPA